MPHPIVVERSQNIADVERWLEELRPGSLPRDLVLPTQLKNWQVGGAAALIQFIITWAKLNPLGRLITHAQNTDQSSKQLARLADESHGLVSILMAKDVILRSGIGSIRAQAYEAAKSEIEKMNEGVAAARRGSELFFLCADHTTKAYLSAFYNQTDSSSKPVKSTKDFAAFAKHCLQSVAGPIRSSVLLDETFSRLGLVLHELFQNTDDWARTDWKGLRLPRSVRGIRIELTARTAEAIAATVEGCPPLVQYVKNQNIQLESARQNLLEISVFDSGPGLARRWLSREVTTDDSLRVEYEAAIACLNKHSTSSRVTHRGLGLHRVMQTLSAASGFLRIRSGRLAMFRDFARDPYHVGEDSSDTALHDWISGRSGDPSEVSAVEGTLFTILLPLSPLEGGQ